MELLRFARILRRRWLLITALAVVGAGIGIATSAFRETSVPVGVYFQSTETLTNKRDSSASDSGFQNLNQVGVLVTNGDVPARVAEKLGGSPDALVEKITVTSNDALGILQITAISPNASEADRVAKTFGTELVASLDAQGLKTYDSDTKSLLAKRDSLKTHEAQLDAQIAAAGLAPADDLRAERDATADELRLTLTQIAQHSFDSPQTSPVEVLDEPQALPISRTDYEALLARGRRGDHLTQVNADGEVAGAASASSGPDLSGPVPRGVLGGTLGLVLGVGLALLLDAVDRRVRSREELEAAFDAPVLAEIPDVSRRGKSAPNVISAVAPYSRAAEGYRAVRSAVLFELALAEQHRSSDGARRSGLVVMVASGVVAEGKTTTTANLATAFAEAGSNVLAVNGDFRRPALHLHFGVDDVPGNVIESGVPGVHVVTSMAVDASATPAQVVEAQRQLIHSTRRHYDVVILDTAPLLSTNDAVDIAPLADLVLVVARYGITKQHHARRTREVLERLRAPVGGLVFVAAPSSSDDARYYYYGSRRAPERLAVPAPHTNGSSTSSGNGTGQDPGADEEEPVTALSWRPPEKSDPTGV